MATLGFTTFVMQDGFMKGLFGTRNDRTNASLLAGYYNWYTIRHLAMDYEVFLMSRIHEEYSKNRG